MSVRPKFNFFLVHQETGQRYPVSEEVVIGRVSGDILFPDDAKVSNQHCRVLMTPKGLAIHDFESSNGTFVDGIRLDPKKVYVFKPGSVVSLGSQQLKLQEASTAKSLKRKRKRRRRKKGGYLDLQTFLALALMIGAASYFLRPYLPNPPSLPSFSKPAKPLDDIVGAMPTPLEIVEREMRAAFNEYTKTGKAHTEGQVSDKELAQTIRQRLIPQLTAARAKMDVLRPQNEWEKRKIDANKKLLTALLGQVNAMASYTETKLARYARELESYGDQVEKLNEEVQKLDDARRPAMF